ncbi:MAG: hypothetical protein IMY77_00810 [Chloroflexi bacterium]|nr:hypothetical protein [Chloroflexota bacterium]
MDDAENLKIISELKDFYKELKSYKRLLNLKGRLSDKDRLRETLVRKIGALKTIVIKLTGKEHIQRFGTVYNIWDVGLTTHRVSDICDVALDCCIDAVNEAIGKLESETNKLDITDEKGKSMRKPESSTDNEDNPFGQAIELELRTTPDVLSPVIRTYTSEFKYKGLSYKAIKESVTASQTFRKILITVAKFEGSSISHEDGIGIITIQSLGDVKSMFRIPPRKQWHINIEPKTIAIAGDPTCYGSHIARNNFNLFYDDSYFSHFLGVLLSELQRLGFKETKKQKAWRKFKEILEVWNKVKP